MSKYKILVSFDGENFFWVVVKSNGMAISNKRFLLTIIKVI